MKSDTEILVISGMSGAGKSTIAHTLEDLGWYVVDNLPPALLENLIDLVNVSMKRIAIVIDVRGRAFFNDLTKSLALLADQGVSRKILFVDAADEVLVRRFESTRRPHPLQGSDRVLDGIAKERERLREVKDSADLVIDSTSLNIHQLKLEQYIGCLYEFHLMKLPIARFHGQIPLICLFVGAAHFVRYLTPPQ